MIKKLIAYVLDRSNTAIVILLWLSAMAAGLQDVLLQRGEHIPVIKHFIVVR